jgi:phosphate transport system permease protein
LRGDDVPTDSGTPGPTPDRSLTRQVSVARVKEQFIRLILFLCALASIVTTVAIIFVLVNEAIFAVTPGTAFFQEVSLKEFFTSTRWEPQYDEKHFGVMPLVAGTLLVAGIAAVIGLPLGLASSIYLSEYASPQARNIIKPILELLAGIPTVVYGYFALVFVTPYLLRPVFQDWLGFSVDVFNAASAGIVVGIMIIPTISSLSEDVLRSVPRGLREAGYALGSTKFDVSVKIVVPAALSGILASFLLAISRAIGETMAVVIAAGQSPNLSLNPFRNTETMTAYIVNMSLGDTPVGSIAYKSLYAVALSLFVITLLMNIGSQFILRRFREVYQ